MQRDSQAYKDLISAGYVERDRWMIKPEQQPLNVTNEIHQEMNMTAIIKKLDEVITQMKSFDIQVNLDNIYGAIGQVAQQINFLQVENYSYLTMLELLKGVQAKLENTYYEIKLLSERYAEVDKK